ncbi:MAG: pilus assembly protein PilM [Candidatus Yonathbacteria bacterium]|nr:pilus assembly protein PilM [Candidatus Yonathbacteria bacterium]
MERSKFYKFFPPPQFLQMPAVGLDISDVSMRFVELVEKRKGFVIGRFGERAIPRGVIESGEVKKPAELRAIFSDIKKAYDLEFVSVSLPEEKAYLFDLRLPTMKYREIRGAIELSLEDHVPLRANETLFDYDIVKETETALHVSVSAVPRTFVLGYLEAFSGTGISPTAFEVEAQSVARSVVPEGDMQSFMLVDFGKTRTGIAIVSEGTVEFTSTVPIGGSSLTDAIAKNLKVTYDEAEKIKREKGILGSTTNENVSLSLMTIISILRDEITRHQSYWQTHNDEFGKKRADIQKIYLCGGDSNLAGFAEYLASGLYCPVELANTLVNVNTLDKYVPEISFNDSLRYATAIGLALRRPK